MLILFANVGSLEIETLLDAPSHAFYQIRCARVRVANVYDTPLKRRIVNSVSLHPQDLLVCPSPFILLESIAFASW